MPLGPRLDRPSAVGDEGRPRATSLTVSAVVVVGMLVAAGLLVGRPLQFLSVALLVGLTTAGVALLNRDRLGATVVGHLCFLPPAVGLTFVFGFAAVFSLSDPGIALLVTGGLAAMVGVSAGWNDIFSADQLRSALVSSALSYVCWLCGLVVLFGVGLFAAVGWVFVDALASGTSPLFALFGLLGLTAVAATCLYVAVRAVPAIQLTPAHRREAARARYARLKNGLLYLTGGAIGLAVVLFLVVLTGVLTPLLQVLGTPLTLLARVVTIPLTAVAVLSLLLALGTWTTRQITVERDEVSTRTAAAVVAAVCYTFAIAFSAPLLGLIVFSGGAAAVAIAVGPLLVYALVVCLLVLLYVGLVPERAGPSALTAAGLLALGLGGALSGFPSPFVFAAVAGALVAWDLGTFGLGVTAELGHIPETRRLELYHAVFALGVGLVGVGLLTGLDFARRAVGAGVGTPWAMGLAVVGVLLLLLPLRG